MRILTHRLALVALMVVIFAPVQMAQAGWPWKFPWIGSSCKSAEEAEKEAWYASRAADPVGTRQKYFKGKYWPPFPRPTGPSQLPTHVFHATVYWPHPFPCYDRAVIRAFSRRQINNGWISETTLYDYHFDSDNHKLNHAGRRQLVWILQNTPSNHRFAFVQTANSSEASQMRTDSVRSEATAMVGKENVPPIRLRVTTPLGRPALEVLEIRRKDIDTMLDPRISNPIDDAQSSGGDALGGSN